MKNGKRKDHVVGWDYELTPHERCRGLKALCNGRSTCLEVMNTHSHMQLLLPMFLQKLLQFGNRNRDIKRVFEKKDL